MSDSPDPVAVGQIVPTSNGPYMVTGGVSVTTASGQQPEPRERVMLCRCGQSSNKPFCDGTHGRVGFDGTLVADHEPMSARRDVYEGDGITIYDDRRRCAHAGFCTDGLPQVWKLGEEPWINPTGATREEIIEVIRRCPSGALTYALPGDPAPVEEQMTPEIVATPNGPYRIRGGIPVVSPDGAPYEVRMRQTLCRCGQSKNKPFCDGTHWYVGFKDPA